MKLTHQQKKYLVSHIKQQSLEEIAKKLKVKTKDIKRYALKRWGKEKLKKIRQKHQTKSPTNNLEGAVLKFSFAPWLEENRVVIAIQLGLVIIAYANTLNNGFVSDDIRVIAQNQLLDSPAYFTSLPFRFFRPFLYYITNQFFGRIPLFYRLINIFFHSGTVIATHLLVSLLNRAGQGASPKRRLGSISIDPLAFAAAALLAIHPIHTEAVTWISGGVYPQYSFFLLVSIILYLLSLKDRRWQFASWTCFLLGLFSDAKAMVLPIILLALVISFSQYKKHWKRLLPFFAASGAWAIIHFLKIPRRIEGLYQTTLSAAPKTNPLYQIPVAITSYLKLILWPSDLTLYHTELQISPVGLLIRIFLIVGVVTGAVYAYKRQKQVFFWLSFFIITLLPTLTPLGISWIVAERYVYLGALGIYAALAHLAFPLLKTKESRAVIIVIYLIITAGLLVRTIARNKDWKNEDTLWLAAAKTSPSSHQNHNNLGDLYSRRGNLPKAKEEFIKAVELNPRYAAAYHNLASTQAKLGEIEEAIENYQRAASLDPTLWQSHQQLAIIYYSRGEYSLTREHLEKALNINPQSESLQASRNKLVNEMEKTQDRGEQSPQHESNP